MRKLMSATINSTSTPGPAAMVGRGMGSWWKIVAVCALALASVIPAGPISADVAETYVKLGNGGCRTPQGTMGNYVTVRDVSFNQCRQYCDEAPRHDKRCWGIEYHAPSRYCELHTKEIDHASGSGPSVCYKNICTGSGKAC